MRSGSIEELRSAIKTRIEKINEELIVRLGDKKYTAKKIGKDETKEVVRARVSMPEVKDPTRHILVELVLVTPAKKQNGSSDSNQCYEYRDSEIAVITRASNFGGFLVNGTSGVMQSQEVMNVIFNKLILTLGGYDMLAPLCEAENKNIVSKEIGVDYDY